MGICTHKLCRHTVNVHSTLYERMLTQLRNYSIPTPYPTYSILQYTYPIPYIQYTTVCRGLCVTYVLF